MLSEPEPIRVPDSGRLGLVQKIGDLREPYSPPADYDRLFAGAMLECVAWHADHSEFYRKTLQMRGFDPSSVETIDDCERIPFIPANFFKAHEILSIPRQDVFMHFTSSGTTGQKSQIFFDRWSFRAGQRMVDSVFEYFGFASPEGSRANPCLSDEKGKSEERTPSDVQMRWAREAGRSETGSRTNYLLYSYETEPDSKLGTAYTDHYLCQYAPAGNIFHALRRTGTGSHEFDVFGCIRALQDYEAQGLPVRIFGFPAFLYFTLRRMQDLKLPRLRLSPDSLVFLGGGWKGHADQAVSKERLYELIYGLLGIPDERIRDSFGAVEHPIPYAECPRHRFHVPVWSRAIIRDVRSLKPCGFGERGFLQFLTPFLTSIPAHSVLVGDLASLYPGEDCGCGIGSPYFIVHGRAGLSKNKSCAVAAAELLGR